MCGVSLSAQMAEGASGAIAQQGSAAASHGGVAVGGDVGGNVVTGDNNSVTYIVHQYQDKTTRPLDQAELRRQIVAYLDWVRERCGTIELRGIKREGQQVVQLELDTAYIPLEAELYEPPEEERHLLPQKGPEMKIRSSERRSIELNNVLGLGQRVILTGGPGCGKTTVLLHIAWTLAAAIATDAPALAQAKLGLADALPLPLFVPLSAYAAHLRQLPGGASARDRTLAGFISRYLVEKQTCFDLPEDFFQQLMRNGQAVILLLDGLDEVPDEAERVRVRQAIEELVTGRETMRVVVTCRTAAYQGRTALGKGFREVRVRPLDDKHIEALVRGAYNHIYRHDPAARQAKATELLQGIGKLEENRRQRSGTNVERLVSSPLLVRMLLVVHFSERRLPEQRAELYMKATDAMLLPDYAPDEEIADRLGKLVGGSREVHRDLVQHLAFAMHSRGEAQGREISEDNLKQILQADPAYTGLMNDFIALTRLRGTLLEERLGVYRFIHLAFQEYLAARYLAEVKRDVEGIVSFLESGPALDSWWREPILLIAGYLGVTSPQTARGFVRRLAGVGEKAAERNARLEPDVQMACAELAGVALLEWQTAASDLQREIAGRIAALYENIDMMNRARPTLRATAGVTLARLGDPREAVTTLDKMELCLVPQGPFWMGSPDEDKMAFDREKPLHQFEVPYDFWIGRYPVTMVQFSTFVEASGYEPRDKDSLLGVPNHPVVWVTWYDAVEFCKWLTQDWRRKRLLPDGLVVRLPSESEWEKAARGGIQIPNTQYRATQYPISNIKTLLGANANGKMQGTRVEMMDNPMPERVYPWGNEDCADRANYGEMEIGTTSAMGCFPRGASPYGALDMSGNVYEWTQSLWGNDFSEPDFKYPYNPQDGREKLDADLSVLRVLRGGAFDYSAGSVRCAFRGWDSPGLRHYNAGFRLVIAPGDPF